MVPSWQDGVFQQRLMEYVVNPTSLQWNLRHKPVGPGVAQPPAGAHHGGPVPGGLAAAGSGMPQKAPAQAHA